MKTLLAIACLLLAACSAHAEPWVISGQTNLSAGTSVDNPTPANAGAIGAVTSLPYTVPAGKQVCIHAYGMEGYDFAGIAVLFVWTGNPNPVTAQWRIDHGLPSAAAKDGSQEITGMNFCFPAGTVINIRLINGQSSGSVYGWYVTGSIDG
ncbi:MAG: hypothetical protein GEU92_19005 [Alphaproteobacteria bacterium]|nr:hypothetical protein [Alphaproteobacteria bacterium]